MKRSQYRREGASILSGLGVARGPSERRQRTISHRPAGTGALLKRFLGDELPGYDHQSLREKGRLISEVFKIQCHPKIFPSQELDHRLQIILLLSGDPDLAILKLALDI